jgi:hypothetical protein
MRQVWPRRLELSMGIGSVSTDGDGELTERQN